MPSGRLRFPALLAGILLHLAAGEGLWHDRPVLWILLVHGLGAASWGFGVAGWLPPAQLGAWWLPAGCALVFPGLGPLASLVFIKGLRTRPVDDAASRYVIWNELPREVSDTRPTGTSAQSIVEILQGPHTQLRRNAILALRELEPHLAIPLLRKGLQDSDEQVRIYAQNILSTMLESFEGRIKDLEEKVRADPRAAATARRLAEQFFELVYLDVAGDDNTAGYYLAKALALIEHAAEAAPDDHELALLGLKYALRARNLALARLWCARLPASNLEAQHVLPWRMELAFLAGDWAELRRLFGVFTGAGFINPRVDEVIRFWNGEPEPTR